MTNVDQTPKVIQVTSAIPNEGKSALSMCLACSAAAMSGLKVAIVDTDFRHPTISRFFGMEKAAGVVDYLLGAAEFDAITHIDEQSGVHVFARGGKTQNPARPTGLGADARIYRPAAGKL